MIKERYVSFEVAKLLRDKGFDGEVHNWYVGDENLQAPSQAVVCDWIEEKYNISIEVYVNIIGYTVCLCYALQDPNTASDIIQDNIPDGDNPDSSWSSKELAYDNAIKYVLTELV